MTFMEAGVDWLQMVMDTDTTGAVIDAGNAMIQRNIDMLDGIAASSGGGGGGGGF